MPKFMLHFTYSSGSWARMMSNPLATERISVAEATVGSLGGLLECMYWELGTHDGIAIAELPDSVSAGALQTAATATGAFKTVATHELLTQQQLIDTLYLAKDAAEVYEVPGQRN
jgi:uncharacterized protein with GYD domain